MKQRVDFLSYIPSGLGAVGMRAYINHKQVKGLKCIDIAEGYDMTYKEGSFYFMYTLYADERDIEVENATLKISRK